MLRLLLLLSTLGLVAGAAQTFTEPKTFDLSDCAIGFYGKVVSQLQVVSSKQLVFDDISVSLPADGSEYTYEMVTSASSLPDNVEKLLETLTGAVCAVKIEVQLVEGTEKSKFYFTGYGNKRGGLFFEASMKSDKNVNIRVAQGKRVLQVFTSTSNKPFPKMIDLTGCRVGGQLFKLGETVSAAAAECTRSTCSVTTEVISKSICEAGKGCLGNNKCGTKRSCSVVGPGVVDFGNRVGSVRDFCPYIVYQRGSSLSVVAYFTGRGRTDTAFLRTLAIFSKPSMFMTKDSVSSYSNGTPLDLSGGSPVKSGDVTYSKDDKGVTAVYGRDNIKVTIFFDGVVLHVTEIVGDKVVSGNVGMCVIATKLVRYGSSSSSCSTVKPDVDEKIDCKAVTSRCEEKLKLVGENALTPAFQSVCKSIFCKYPEGEGLMCNVMDAFARKADVQGWRENSGCPASVCVAHDCVSHEYCAVSVTGLPACFCKATDYRVGQYKAAKTYGPEPTCSKNSVSTTILTCFLEEKGFDPAQLHLKSSTCKGTADNKRGRMSFSYSSSDLCGGSYEVMEDKSIQFSNEVLNSESSTVAFEDSVSISFSCTYQAPKLKTASFRIADGSVSVSYTSGDFSYSLDFSLYTDETRLELVKKDSALGLNQQVWALVKASDVGGDTLVLVLDSCWATPESNPQGKKKYQLISKGCPAPSDGSVAVLSNGAALESSFKFNVFSFVGASGKDIYMHCQASLCVKDDGNCAKACE